MKTDPALQYQVLAAIRACEDKKAEDITVLQLEKGSGAFTDYFVLCSGTNPRQVQAIADEVEERLAIAGLRANSREGYKLAEWILLDYVDFVVHIFSDAARKYYDLERLWKSARRLEPAEVLTSARVPAARHKAKPKPRPAARRPVARSRRKAARPKRRKK
jgi:ribosome-associated protein